MSENDPYDVTRQLVERVEHKMTQSDFRKLDARIVASMNDKELATWQSDYTPDSPQSIFANNEWQRRLMTKQVQATRFAAWVGMLGVVIGTLLGWTLTSWRLPVERSNDLRAPSISTSVQTSPIQYATPSP